MEITNDQHVKDSTLSLDKNFLQISCTWQISNNKQFHDAFTVIPSSQEPKKTDVDDVVSLDTCISLQPAESCAETCTLDIKLTNGQRISKIAVVSEAYVLEFFKQFGEYETTVFAELVDEFEESFVYFAETAILPHTTEASIKFAKTKSKSAPMWVYGIRLYLTDPSNEPKNVSAEMFNPEIIKKLLTKVSLNNEGNKSANDVQSCYRNLLNSSRFNCTQESNGKEVAQSSSENTVSSNTDIVSYIDKKFKDIEERLMIRINEMEQKTNQKLDTILKQLESHCSVK